MKRLSKRKSYAVMLSAWAAVPAVVHAASNTPDIFNGSSAGTGTALTTATNWFSGAVPIITNDAEFSTAYPAASKTLTTTITGATATYGSLDDINTNGAVTVGDGTTTTNASTITLGGSGDLGNSVSGTAADLLYTATGATLNIVPNTTTGTGALGITLGQAGVFDSAGTLSITSIISGAFGITKTGVGSLTLGGANTYTGGVTLSAGTLNINAAAALGTTAGIFNIGANTTLDNTSGAAVTTNAIPVNLGTAFTFKGTNNLAFGGVANISTGVPVSINVSAGTLTFSNYLNGSSGTITKLGAGTLSLGGFSNTFAANINLSGGTLQVYGGANLGASANQVTLLASSTIQFSNGVGVSGSGGAHTFNTGSYALSLDPQALSVQLGNLIDGSGSLVKVGTGTITLNAADTYPGLTNINAGTLGLTTTASMQSSGLVFNGGTFNIASGHTSNQSFGTTSFNAGVNVISVPALSASNIFLSLGTISRTAPSTVDFTLPSTGSITTTSSNALFAGGQASIIGGYATVGGTTWATVTSGTIGGLATYDNTFAVPGADVDVIATVNQDPSVSAINSVRFNTAAATSLNVSSGGLAIATGGILETAAVGANVSNISGGAITSNNGQDLIIIQNNASAPLIIGSAITNASGGTAIGITKAGAGTVIIAGTNTNTGPTNIYAGTLIVGNGGTTEALGSGAVLDNGTLGFNQSGTTTFSNAITGTGILQMNGTGTLVLPIVTTYAGGNVVNAGTLQFATTSDAGNGGFTLNGGAIRETATITSGRLFTINGTTSTIDVSSGFTFTFSSATSLAGSGTLNVNNATTTSTTGVADSGTLSVATLASTFTGAVNVNAGELLLTSTANTYAGSFNVAGGTLYGYTSGSFGTAPITLGAAKLEINDAASTSNIASTLATALTVNSTSSIIQIGTSVYPNTVTASGAISGTGMLNKTGPGAIIFTNSTANSYSGGTTDYQGTLTSAVSGSFGTGDLVVSPNQTAKTALDNATVNASTGSLATTANVTLTNEAGDTNANGSSYGLAIFNVTGPLQIGSLSGTGQVNLLNVSGNTLTIGGSTNTTFSGIISQAAGGTTSLVKTGTGGLTLSGTSNISGGTTITGGTLTIGATSALSSLSAVNVSAGTLDVSGFNTSVPALTVGTLGTLNIGLGNVMAVTGVATFGGTLNISSGTAGTLPENLITYGSDTGTFASVLGIPTGDTLLYTATALELITNGPANLTYLNNDGPWDVATSASFNGSSGATVFHTGDNVTFDDSYPTGSYNVSVTAVVSPGSTTFNNSSGNYNLSGTGSISGSGGLTKLGSGIVTLGISNSYTGPTNISSGKLVLNAVGALPYNASVTIGSGAYLIVKNLGAPTGLSMNSLTNNGILNLNNNTLAVHGGSLTTLDAQVATGFNGGKWNNTSGIISITAQNDFNHLTALGVIQNTADGSSALHSTLDGLTGLTASDVLVKFTFYGDTNLDGVVDGSDYSRIDSSYESEQSGPAVTGWFNGDFNYDNVVDGSDYTLIDNAFNSEGSTTYASEVAPLASATAEIAGTSSVPEPTTLGLLGLGAMGLLGRRRRA